MNSIKTSVFVLPVCFIFVHHLCSLRAPHLSEFRFELDGVNVGVSPFYLISYEPFKAISSLSVVLYPSAFDTNGSVRLFSRSISETRRRQTRRVACSRRGKLSHSHHLPNLSIDSYARVWKKSHIFLLGGTYGKIPSWHWQLVTAIQRYPVLTPALFKGARAPEHFLRRPLSVSLT